jgi:hypothetical protein
MQGEEVLAKQKDREPWEMTEAEKDCQRCLRDGAARYRVYTDAIDMAVCRSCAEEARAMGIKVELLDLMEKKANSPRQRPLDCGKQGRMS